MPGAGYRNSAIAALAAVGGLILLIWSALTLHPNDEDRGVVLLVVGLTQLVSSYRGKRGQAGRRPVTHRHSRD
ncbi:MAG TPA: hypothetical protein VGJ63_22100 [Micromonosporaceae bacterium]|jgi:hypothetical protein